MICDRVILRWRKSQMPGIIFGAGSKDEIRKRSATEALSWSA